MTGTESIMIRLVSSVALLLKKKRVVNLWPWAESSLARLLDYLEVAPIPSSAASSPTARFRWHIDPRTSPSRSISGAEHRVPISLADLKWLAEGRADRSQGHAQLCAHAEGRREESATRAWDCTRDSPSHLASQTPASRHESASL